MNESKNNICAGVVKQLKSMLTNHPERKHSVLKVTIIDRKDNSLKAREEFEIYANDPIEKIKEKVYKLRYKGNYSTLELKEFVEKTEGYFILILAI